MSKLFTTTSLILALTVPALAASLEDKKTLTGLAELLAYDITCQPNLKPQVYENMTSIIEQLPFSMVERKAAVMEALSRVKAVGAGPYCSYAATNSRDVLRALGQ